MEGKDRTPLFPTSHAPLRGGHTTAIHVVSVHFDWEQSPDRLQMDSKSPSIKNAAYSTYLTSWLAGFVCQPKLTQHILCITSG